MYRLMRNASLNPLIKEKSTVIKTKEENVETEKEENECIKRQQAKAIVSGMLDSLAGKTDLPDTVLKTSAETCRLNDRQREVLKKTFNMLEHDAVKYGLRILVALFAEYPKYKQIWPQFRSIPDSSLMNAIELRRHASVYMSGLRQIIYSMNNEGELAEQLNRIARAHIKWNIHKHHIQHMLEPVLDVLKLANGELDDETKEAWTTLYDVIAKLIEIYRNVNKPLTRPH